ncbi:hypothetical protein CCACVL1_16677 [Corchorus capsularis]|uniref:F-box domain-containing protein n=1 Tax=Corchorus capsularis TaxID=210143 RepID=A0A1R3HVV5_COCAP|nr:hypothetical protein CCACVL1_16677 [Corchorus capsularis]
MADSDQPPSKNRRISSDENGIDLISDLPDSVLGHIMSFLPTEDALTTSILSKRWVDLWAQVPAFVFDSPHRYPAIDRHNESSFVYFVCKVMLISQAQSISKFTFDRNFDLEFDVDYLRTWISNAVGRNVQDLSLNFRCPQPHINLPDCLFACKTLVSLKLENKIFVDVPATGVNFPCLKILQLMAVKYANDDSMRRVLSGCPVLEDLTVERLCGDNLFVLEVNVISLKRITVKRRSAHYIPWNDPPYKLLISAPMLERIVLKDENYRYFLLEDGYNLAEAVVEISNPLADGRNLCDLLEVFADVRSLSLFHNTIWFNFPSEVKFPVLTNLVQLDIECACKFWLRLLALLECSDNLKILVFRNVRVHSSRRKCDQALVETVPKCVSMSLVTLHFKQVYNCECDWKLVKYFLKNAKFLKQVKIGISFRLKKRRHLLRKLLKYPRASMACEIAFFFASTNEEIRL